MGAALLLKNIWESSEAASYYTLFSKKETKKVWVSCYPTAKPAVGAVEALVWAPPGCCD